MPSRESSVPPLVTMITKASVLICSRNRAQKLESTLSRFLRESESHASLIEVLVVDNGSTDQTREVIERSAQLTRIRVRYLSEPKRGKSRALNHGLALAEGDLILLTDDDCVPARSWVAHCIEAFERDSSLQLLGGRVELADPNDAKVALSLGTERKQLRSAFAMYSAPKIMGANMAFRRSLLDDIGTFDTRLGPGSRANAVIEDHDYVYRAIWSGAKVVYDPSVVVFHYHGRQHEVDVIKVRTGYTIGRGAFYAKHALRDREVAKLAYWDVRRNISKLGSRNGPDSAHRVLWLYCRGALSRII